VKLIQATIAMLLLSTSSGMASIPDQRLSGLWGGLHISLNITTEGGTIEFDCAHGDIAQGVFLDRHSNFTVFGTYTDDHLGPAKKDAPPKVLRARYEGHVSGTHMTLTVTRTDTNTRIGSFTADRGKEAKLTKCK
jgi:hypothetical protein